MSAADVILAAPSREPSRHSLTTRIVIYGLLVFFAAVYLVPLIVMVMTSLKPLDEITGGNMFYFPHDLTFEPWKKAWGTACVGLTCEGIKGYVWNSVKMVVPAVIISSLLGALNVVVLEYLSERAWAALKLVDVVLMLIFVAAQVMWLAARAAPAGTTAVGSGDGHGE